MINLHGWKMHENNKRNAMLTEKGKNAEEE